MLDWLASRLTRLRQAPGEIPISRSAGVRGAPEPVTALQLYEAGRIQQAEHEVQRQLQSEETNSEALLVQGLIALDRSQHQAASKAFERLTLTAPDDTDGWVGLGRARAIAGRPGAAQAAWQKARKLDPNHPGLRAELALAAAQAGNEVEAALQLADAAGPGRRVAEAHFQLGNLLLQRQRAADATRHFKLAVAAHGDHANAQANLGAVLKEQGLAQEAEPHLQKALQLEPGLPQAAYNLAMLGIDQGRWDSAADLLRLYLRRQPKDVDAHYWLGNALMGQGDAVQARQAYLAALRLNGNHVRARWGYAMAQLPAIAGSETEQSDSVEAFARELEKLKTWLRTRQPPDAYAAVGAQQPFYLAYIEKNHCEVLGKYGALCSSLMTGWARKAGVAPPARAPIAARLRIGIVSAHINSHSVWHAILRGWVEHLDRSRFELHLFHTGATRDAETQWAARHVARLHHKLGDWTSWAKAISDGRFDVLIYPEIGMDATTARLSTLRLARAQLASWGHPITTGIPQMDVFLSAQAFEPADAASHYTEKLIALPRLGCCYSAYATKPEPVDMGALGIGKNDHVLLCAGHSIKYAPRDDALLVQLARRCAPCKLVFFRGLGDSKVALLEQRLNTAFTDAGLDFAQYVRFIPWQPQSAFFGLLQQADVFLDSVGFSGFNTAMQAVQCGTPIVAWEGAFMRGRFASGILRQMGLDQWVANSAEQFVEYVERLCADAGTRQQASRQIVEGRRPLFDDKATVDELARHLQELAHAA